MTNHLLTVALAPVAALLLPSTSPAGDRGAPDILPPGPAHAETSRSYAAGPSVAVAANGRLWATWHAGGTAGEDCNGYIVLATSVDGGTSWKEIAIADPDGPGPRSMSDPELWASPDGKLRWTFSERVRIGREDDIEGRTCLLCMAVFPDAGIEPLGTLPKAKTIWPGAMMGKPIVASNGTWLMPLERFFTMESSGVLASSDGGTTWVWRGAATLPKQDRSFDEHSLVEDSQGRLHCFSRTASGPIFHGVSADGGRNWTESHEPRIVNVSARSQVRRLKSGRWLLIKHGLPGEKTGSRTRLAAAISEDEGRTWKGGLLLDDRDVSYPDCDEGANGLIYVVYDRERTKAKEILLATFTEADVLAGRDVSGRLCLRRKITPKTHR